MTALASQCSACGIRATPAPPASRHRCRAALTIAALTVALAAPAAAEETIIYFHQDALGSVRLVTGRGGEVLARHDYLPFGEEVPAGQFGRASEAGYGAVEVAPQHFTGKERDTESGLDYFGARYYSGPMGRFTSRDSVGWLAWQHGTDRDKRRFARHLGDPQRLGLFAYGRNNPLRFIDPTGMYICQGSKGECEGVQLALDNIRMASGSSSLDASQKAALTKVVEFYGDPGQDNNVKVVVGRAGGDFAQILPEGKGWNVTLDLGLMRTVFGVNSELNKDGSDVGVEIAGAVAHEGQHGTNGKQRTRAAVKADETSAYTTAGYVNMGLGFNSAFGFWTIKGGWNQAAVEAFAEESTESWCKAGGGCP